MARETLASRILNEVAIYGGLPLRRGDILRLASEHLGPEQCHGRFGAQYFALHGPVVDLEPWSLDEARKVMAA